MRPLFGKSRAYNARLQRLFILGRANTCRYFSNNSVAKASDLDMRKGDVVRFKFNGVREWMVKGFSSPFVILVNPNNPEHELRTHRDNLEIIKRVKRKKGGKSCKKHFSGGR